MKASRAVTSSEAFRIIFRSAWLAACHSPGVLFAYVKTPPPSEWQDASQAGQKIIRNASLDVTARDASILYKNIVDFGESIGGYECSYPIQNHKTYSVINAEFKVPPEKLIGFAGFIGENGNVVSISVSIYDITEDYFDTSTRLETKRGSLDQYYQLLSSASNVEEIVYIQRIIDGITEDIESLEGRLKVWDNWLNMATVNLRIRQDNDPIQIKKEINWDTLSTSDILWIIIAAGVFLWIILRKRKRANNTSISDKK